MRCALCLILIYGSLTCLQSQNSNWFAGARVAYQNTWILNSDDFDQGGELDYVATFKPAIGLILGYKLNSKLNLQTGISYSLQGQNYETAGNEDADYETELNYLKIPLLLSFRPKPDSKIGWIVQGGLQISLLSDAKSSRENFFGIYSSVLKDAKNYYVSTGIEFVAGLGAEYQTGSHAFRFMLQADYGLSDIEKTEKKPGLRSVSSNATIALPMLSYLYAF
ncbi:MAG: PorT family protein [Saprospiraceae bacterium]|nr:PorT family protein [Saprospiraceae bacterium]